MYYLLLTPEGLERMDVLPFDVPEDIPYAVCGEPMELFRVISPASGLPMLGLCARTASGEPISAMLGGGLTHRGARMVTGPLAVFGLRADGTHRDLENEEMDGFVCEDVPAGQTRQLQLIDQHGNVV